MGEGKEFAGKSLDDILAQGEGYYKVPKGHLKFSILEEKKDLLTGELVEMRVWIDRPDMSAIRKEAAASDTSIQALTSIVQEIFKIANLDLGVQAKEGEESFELDITGRDRELILDKHGDFLNALQYVLGKIISKQHRVSKKVIVDSDGFRERRSSELIEIALHAAERVRKMGEDYELGPLTPYERRLVHVALGTIEGVRTFSTGDGFMKKLIIAPASEE